MEQDFNPITISAVHYKDAGMENLESGLMWEIGGILFQGLFNTGPPLYGNKSCCPILNLSEIFSFDWSFG